MRLVDLIEDIDKYLYIGEDVEISHLSHHSDLCEMGSLFFAIEGTKINGTKYIESAISNGAVAVVTSKKLKVNIPQVIVDNVRLAMAIISKKFYDNACDRLKIIGIVGTNGKTTSSYLIKNILAVSGFSVGLIGTNGIYIDNNRIAEDLTTPDPIDIHRYISYMVESGVDYCIMEVSAHAIDLYKVAGIKFKVGLYTNISNEHLDYFVSMKNYINCKKKFFDSRYIEEAVINVDDEVGMSIAKKNSIPCVTYGMYNPSNTFAVNVVSNINGSKFVVNALDSIISIETSLIGEYNVYNILGAISVCKLLSIRDENIECGIRSLENIEGRCNITKIKNNNYIVIDFAHTPDGMENILSVLRRMSKGKIVTIFGCVDYSDTKKRSLMGQVASKYSDYIILTSDNPNFADVKTINKDIKYGFHKFKNYTEIEDRVEAIRYGMSMLCQDDMLVILGKGGEKKQVVCGEKLEYNEQKIVNNLLRDL